MTETISALLKRMQELQEKLYEDPTDFDALNELLDVISRMVKLSEK